MLLLVSPLAVPSVIFLFDTNITPHANRKMSQATSHCLKYIFLPFLREIHPLDPQPHRYCMLASTVSAPGVTPCSLGLYWSRDLCSKHALAGWGMSSYLGQIVRGSEI